MIDGKLITKIDNMNQIQQFFTIITMLISLQTALGVLLHDTNVDKALLSSWTKVSGTAHADVSDSGKMPESNPHTHPEHTQLMRTLRDNAAHPRTTPRNSDRKHLHQKRVARNTEFDGHRICIAPGVCF